MQNELQRGEQYARLSELDDFSVSEEDPDPRGWSVLGRDGLAIGRVDDLIIDKDAMKVRYLDITLADPAASGGNHARIPVGRVELERDRSTVVTDLSQAELAAFLSGEFDTSQTGDDDETLVFGQRDAAAGMAASADSFDSGSEADVERVTRAEEELRVGTRQVQAGEVVVGKHVETERVVTPVQRRVEHVRIERRPVSDGGDTAELREGEIRVPIMEEEVVVEKRPVIKEEIVVTREVATQTEEVETDVRREQIDISGDDALIQGDGTLKRQRAGGGNRG